MGVANKSTKGRQHQQKRKVRVKAKAAVVKDAVVVVRGKAATAADATASGRQVTRFQQEVYDAAKRIPKGCVTTYGLLAKALGRPRGSRAVGAALAVNPFAPIVPCHRVICTDGSIGGFFHQIGVDKPEVHRKLDILRSEGLTFSADGKLIDRSRIICLSTDTDSAVTGAC